MRSTTSASPSRSVQLSAHVPEFVTARHHKIIKASEIWDVLSGPRPLAPKFGIGIFELLSKIFDEHFRYKPKYPVTVVLPEIPRRYALFWASVFGDLPGELMPLLNTRFRKPLDVRWRQNFPESVTPPFITLLW
jgi:hypothetical protein